VIIVRAKSVLRWKLRWVTGIPAAWQRAESLVHQTDFHGEWNYTILPST